MNKYIGPDLGQRVEKFDPIIDRSPAQKMARLEQMRAELATMGFSIIATSSLHLLRPSPPLRPLGRPKKLGVDRAEQMAG
jgi:hypothetical protein